LTNDAWDEVGRAASVCANHSQITSDQRAKGQTAIEEQSQGKISFGLFMDNDYPANPN
jgi:hypothetical protein